MQASVMDVSELARMAGSYNAPSGMPSTQDPA